jgi:hypothetical protein
MSWWWSIKGELSGERRNAVKVAIVMCRNADEELDVVVVATEKLASNGTE